MRHSWHTRLASLLLTVLMLGGGGSLPLLDAALGHGSAGAGAPTIHWCSTDGPGTHAEADHCTLGVPLHAAIPESRQRERVVTALPLLPPASRPVAAPHSSKSHSPDRSRAPPALSV